MAEDQYQYTLFHSLTSHNCVQQLSKIPQFSPENGHTFTDTLIWENHLSKIVAPLSVLDILISPPTSFVLTSHYHLNCPLLVCLVPLQPEA